MEEQEFRRLIELFPIVRSRDYQMELDSSRQSTSRSVQDKELMEWQDALTDGDEKESNQEINVQDEFWVKLKLGAEKKVGPAEATRFCKAFQEIHRKLVYEVLSLDAAKSFVNSSKDL